MVNETLSSIKKYLPERWAADTAAQLGVSESLVKKVANGDRNNTEVLDHLIAIALEGKEKSILRLNKLAELNSDL
jgi:hypothetical protein